MGAGRPRTPGALYERFCAVHGERRAELAYRVGMYQATSLVLEGYRLRLEKAERTLSRVIARLEEMRDKEAEWATIVMGCAVQVAQWYDENGSASGCGWLPAAQSPELGRVLRDDALFPPPVERCEPPLVRRCASNHCARVAVRECSVSRETHAKKGNDSNA